MGKYWHYTVETRLEEIIQSEQIIVTMDNSTKKKEKPTCWVSSNPTWEKTATKTYTDEFGNQILMTQEQQLEHFGLARIEVDPQFGFYSWKTFKKIGNVDKKIIQSMEEHGIRLGASPHQWFCSFKPIPIDYWIRAEVFKNGKWIEYDVFEEINDDLIS